MAEDRIYKSEERIYLLTKVCYLYYNEYLTQSQIANQLGITRQMVSRLLQRAKRDGIVNIQINSPTIAIADLEVKLQKAYNLKTAIVIKDTGISPQNLKDKLGSLAAKYLQEVLAPGLEIGLGWGTTLRAMAEYFSIINTASMPGVETIQLMGGMNNVEYNVLAQDIVRLIATSLGAKDRYLLAPCIVKDQNARDMFIHEDIIKDVFERYEGLDYAFLGIGDIADDSIVAQSGNIQVAEINELRHFGAVGEVCLRYFDSKGIFLSTPLSQRTISINIEQLRKVKNVVAVAGGARKHEAILGALKSGIIKILVTDEGTARFLL
jgi:DNA-binding transcriptional regulator LsrR (DeoR family)